MIHYEAFPTIVPMATPLRSLAARLKWARTFAEISQAELAELCGWDAKTGQSRISHYETGRTPKIEPDDLQAISAALRRRGVREATPGWLQYGEGGPRSTRNLEPGPDVHAMVPLISWIQAGDFAVVEDPVPPGEALNDEWYPFPKRRARNVVALRVRGDSMTAPYGKSYPDGSVIFVNLEMRSPNNGQRIVAKLAHEEEATFKVYVEDDRRKWLKPLNPQYPAIFEPFRIVGTVVGKWEDE